MTTEVTTIKVLADRLQEALKELNKLAAKARRYGCPDITVLVGDAIAQTYTQTDWDGQSRKVTVKYVELHIQGEAPRVGQHEFLAKIELHDGGNLVDTRPGVEDLDTRFRDTNGYCAHCNTLRRRNEVFVVRNLETGDQLQVGRDCLRDFLGIDNPNSVAQRFAFWRAARDLEEGFSFGKRDWAQSLEGLLALSAVCVRLFGWCSKGQAQYDANLRPTWSAT